jgi:hypothetical protein
VLDGVGGEQLHRDRHVAEGQVQVDHADPARATLGQRQPEVDGHRGLADAALGRPDREHLAAGGTARRRSAQRREELLGTLDGRGHRLRRPGRHDLARSGGHRLGEHLRGELGADQDHRDGRAGGAQAVTGGQGVVVRHVGAQDHDVLVPVLVQPGAHALQGRDGLRGGRQAAEETDGGLVLGFDDDRHGGRLGSLVSVHRLT